MTPLEALAVLAAGLVAGAMNAVVGAGSLVTFPALVALGVPPLTANVSNTVGLVPGSAAAVVGYRRELAGLGPLLARLVPFSAVGGVAGAALLLAFPASTFEAVVPVLLVLSAVLTLLQPRVAAWLEARGERPAHGGLPLAGGVFATGVYGGYFGAAQGVILIALLGTFLPLGLQRANAVKNVLALVANLVAAAAFALFAEPDWRVATLVAVGSVTGALLGSRYGRRIPAPALRAVIVVVALAAAARLTWG